MIGSWEEVIGAVGMVVLGLGLLAIGTVFGYVARDDEAYDKENGL